MNMVMVSDLTVLSVIQQHAEEAAILRNSRTSVAAGPHIRLCHLQRLDERLAAHLDGLAVAGAAGTALCLKAFERLGVGEVFSAAVCAIESRDAAWLEKIFAIVEAEQSLLPGLRSAFGWVSAQFLQGTIKDLLESSNVFRQQLGVAACMMHRVDPGPILLPMLSSASPFVRAASLRAAGECGRVDLLHECLTAFEDDDAVCRFQAVRSAIFLGDRRASVSALEQLTMQTVAGQFGALGLLMKVVDVARAHVILKTLAPDVAKLRLLVCCAALAGDPYYITWFIKQMRDVKLARIAGQAFATLTGADLTSLGLYMEPQEQASVVPNDDPQDDNVAIDDDDGLPWPDPEKVLSWWDANQHRFQPGIRYFMGEPPSVAHCTKVLRDGYQRQRFAAAEYLCLLQPGRKLFPTSAPAWRQQRWLKQMQS